MIKGNLVAAYLIHSFLYYQCEVSVITDAEYDAICLELLERYNEIEHPHKYLVDPDALRAGSGYHLAALDYPPQVRAIAMCLREDPLYLDKLHERFKDVATPPGNPGESKTVPAKAGHGQGAAAGPLVQASLLSF